MKQWSVVNVTVSFFAAHSIIGWCIIQLTVICKRQKSLNVQVFLLFAVNSESRWRRSYDLWSTSAVAHFSLCQVVPGMRHKTPCWLSSPHLVKSSPQLWRATEATRSWCNTWRHYLLVRRLRTFVRSIWFRHVSGLLLRFAEQDNNGADVVTANAALRAAIKSKLHKFSSWLLNSLIAASVRLKQIWILQSFITIIIVVVVVVVDIIIIIIIIIISITISISIMSNTTKHVINSSENSVVKQHVQIEQKPLPVDSVWKCGQLPPLLTPCPTDRRWRW